jgi:hypothetical protein
LAIGILGNLAAVDDIAKDISSNDLLIDTLLRLLSTTENTGLLTEIFRFFTVCTSNASIQEIWLKFLEDESFLSTVLFILANTLDETLCEKVIYLLINMLWYSDSICEKLKRLNLPSIVVNILYEKQSINPDNLVNPSETCTETLCRLIEIMTTKTEFDNDFMNDDKVLKVLSKLVKTSESKAIVTSSCISIANLEMNKPKSTLAKDDLLVSCLITQMSMEDQNEDLLDSIWTLLEVFIDDILNNESFLECKNTVDVLANNTQRLVNNARQCGHNQTIARTLEKLRLLFEKAGNGSNKNYINALTVFSNDNRQKKK